MDLWKSQVPETLDQTILNWVQKQESARQEYYALMDKYYDTEMEILSPTGVTIQIKGVKANICRAVVEAPVHFLSKNPLSIEVKLPRNRKELSKEQKEKLEEERNLAEDFLYECFEESKLLIKNFIKATRLQAKKGNYALNIYPVGEVKEIEQDGEIVKVIEKIESYKIAVIPPERCFPKWKNIDQEEMEYFAIPYIQTNEKGEKEQWCQVIWPDTFAEFVRPLNGGDWRQVKKWDNHYNFMTVVLVQNKADDTDMSESDITPDVIDLQDMLNKELTDLTFSIDKEAFSDKYIFGADVPRDPKTGEYKTIPIGMGHIHIISGKDGKPASLAYFPPSDFAGYTNAIDKTLDMVSVVTQIPKNELMRGTSGVASGVALEEIYQPFLGKCREKARLSQQGLEEVANKILKMAKIDKVGEFDKSIKFKPKIHIKAELPKDEKIQAEVDNIRINNHTKSCQQVMEENGEENVAERWQQILEERQAIEQSLYNIRLDQEINGEGGE